MEEKARSNRVEGHQQKQVGIRLEVFRIWVDSMYAYMYVYIFELVTAEES